MSSHSHRCIIHPQHNRVGVCAFCLRQRLHGLQEAAQSSTSLPSCDESESSPPPLPPPQQPAPPPPQPESSSSKSSSGPQQQQQQHPPTFLQKFKQKALSIPHSPDRNFSKPATSPKSQHHHKNRLSLPTLINGGRRSSASEADRPAKFTSEPETYGFPVFAAVPPADAVTRPTLRTLFGNNVESEQVFQARSSSVEESAAVQEWRLQRRSAAEQFSIAMRSPGFAVGPRAAALSDYRQTYTAEYLSDHVNRRMQDTNPLPTARDEAPAAAAAPSSTGRTSWISSLFHRSSRSSKRKDKKAAAAQVTTTRHVDECPRLSVDGRSTAARVSVDAEPNPRIRQNFNYNSNKIGNGVPAECLAEKLREARRHQWRPLELEDDEPPIATATAAFPRSRSVGSRGWPSRSCSTGSAAFGNFHASPMHSISIATPKHAPYPAGKSASKPGLSSYFSPFRKLHRKRQLSSANAAVAEFAGKHF